MELEGSLSHSQMPAICPYLTLITTDFNNTCKLKSNPKHVFICLCLITTRKIFSLFVYLTSVIRIYSLIICGGADKSLARPTFRCLRTESIVSLERGVCSCAELQVFSCYIGWKEACQATRAISTTWRREMSSSPPLSPARQGAEGNWRHSDRNIKGTCNTVCYRQKLGGPVR